MKLLFLIAIVCLVDITAHSQRDYSLIPYRKGNLWGFCNTIKTVIVKPAYDEVEWFLKFLDADSLPSTLISKVKKNNKYGLIDNKGVLLAACKYDKIFPFYDYNPYMNKEKILLRKGSSYYEYTVRSKKIKIVIPSMTDTSEQESVMQLMMNCDAMDKNLLVDKKDDAIVRIQKNQYISESQTYRWDTFYIKAKQFRKIDCSHNLLYHRQETGWGLISYAGQEIIPAQYDSIFQLSHESHYAVKNKKGWGILYINATSPDAIKYEVIAPTQYQDIRANLSSTGFVIKKNDQWGLVFYDYTNKTISEHLLGKVLYSKYDFYYSDEIAGVYSSNEKFLGYIHLNGTPYWD